MDVHEVRIVDDELWQAAKDRQNELLVKYANTIKARRAAQAYRLNRTHRPRSLLSGLLECGSCGSSYALRGQDRYPDFRNSWVMPVLGHFRVILAHNRPLRRSSYLAYPVITHTHYM